MTEVLCLKDSYVKEFDAVVKTALGNAVELDKTYFYPLGGGQPSDKGKLVCNGVEYVVLSVRKDRGVVLHELDKPGPAAGDAVHATLDWGFRYRIMRMHTAAHLLSAVVNQETGALISGNQLGLDKSRIDFNLENFDREKLADYAARANEFVSKSIDVSVSEMEREEAFKIPSIVKLKDVLPPSVKMLRIIKIPGVDEQACGGTHVKNTGEIKGIKIVAAENKGASNRRVYFTLAD